MLAGQKIMKILRLNFRGWKFHYCIFSPILNFFSFPSQGWSVCWPNIRHQCLNDVLSNGLGAAQKYWQFKIFDRSLRSKFPRQTFWSRSSVTFVCFVHLCLCWCYGSRQKSHLRVTLVFKALYFQVHLGTPPTRECSKLLKTNINLSGRG